MTEATTAPGPDPDPADPPVLSSFQLGVLRVLRTLTLIAVAIAGAVLSYSALYDAAAKVFGDKLGTVFPLLVDLLIVGASLAYIVGAKIGRPQAGWRLTAHCGVAGTIALNALASPSVDQLPWHLTAPIVWSVLVELTARGVLGEYRAAHAPVDKIAFVLWLTAPIESASTVLRVHRQRAHASARTSVGEADAAREVIRLALPGWSARRTRRILARQLRAGSMTTAQVLHDVLPLLEGEQQRADVQVLHNALKNAIAPGAGAPDATATGAAATDEGTALHPAAIAPLQSGEVQQLVQQQINAAMQQLVQQHLVQINEAMQSQVQQQVQEQLGPLVERVQQLAQQAPINRRPRPRAFASSEGAGHSRQTVPIGSPDQPGESHVPVPEQPLTSGVTPPVSETRDEVPAPGSGPVDPPVVPSNPTPSGTKKDLARAALLANGLSATGAIEVLADTVSPRTVYNVLRDLRAEGVQPGVTDITASESTGNRAQGVQHPVQPRAENAENAHEMAGAV